MKKLIYIAAGGLLLFSSCTNWKAKYFEAQRDLYRCLYETPIIDSTTVDTTTIVTDNNNTVDIFPVVTPPPPPPANDDAPPVKVIYKDVVYQKSAPIRLSHNGVAIHLRIENDLQNGVLRQRVKLDSLKVPVRTIDRTKKVVEYKTEWYKILSGAVVGALLMLVGILLIGNVMRK
jgi:hypothetical protein